MKKWLMVCLYLSIGCGAYANTYTVNDIGFLFLLQREKLGIENYAIEHKINQLPCWDDKGVYKADYSGSVDEYFKQRCNLVCIDERTSFKLNIPFFVELFNYPLSDTFKNDLNDPRMTDKLENIGEIIKENENKQIKALAKTIDARYMLREDYDVYTSKGGSLLGVWAYKAEQGNNTKYYELMISNVENYLKHNVPLPEIKISEEENIDNLEELKNDVSMYNNMFMEVPLLNLSENMPTKVTKKEKFKKLVKDVNKFMGNESAEDISAAINKPYIERGKMMDNYNFQISQIEYRAYNTALMKLGDTKLSDEMEQKINDTDKKADALFEQFQQNPSNMKKNAELIKVIGKAKGEYSNILADLTSNLDEAYKAYTESYKLQKKYLNLPEKDRYGVSLHYDNILLSKPGFEKKIKNSDIDKLKDIISKYDKMADEVCTYSYNYEQQKYQELLVKSGKKIKKGALEQFVYTSQYQPQIGGLYTHNPSMNLYLKVLQTVPGGVILTGSSRVGNGMYDNNCIFLQTSKTFSDGQLIREPITAEYKGYYDYTTVLGVKKRIYKFYRLGQKEIEINSNVSGQTFYFYQPH